ncbi:unknown [Coprobacillus sp. CAG:698]|nr:unknown [Coprobacillus sp. CAG:698]
MNKPELGNRIYKIFMVITVIILLSVLLLFKQFEMENESFYRYMVFVLSFNGVLSTGAIIREFYSLVYDKKKMIIKIVVSAIMILIGIIETIFFPIDLVGLITFILGLMVSLYVLTPTVKQNNNQ